MNIEIFYKIENKIKDLLSQFGNDLIEYQKHLIIINKSISEYEIITSNQTKILNTLIALRDEIYLSHIYRNNINNKDSEIESMYKSIEINLEIHKSSQDENIKTIKILNSKLGKVKESIKVLESKIKHSSRLLSYFDTFFSSISNLEILDDYRFCPPMIIGYDLENRLPISFEWVDKFFSYGIILSTSEKPIIKFSSNQLIHNEKNINLKNEDLAFLLNIVKCFNLGSDDLQIDYLIIPNHYQDGKALDFIIDSPQTLSIQKFYGKIYTEEFDIEWNGKYENAPLRVKLILDFIFNNYFNVITN